MIWQNYCLETLSKQHVSQMKKYSLTFCIDLFRFFPTSKMCFISLWERKWTLECLNHQEVSFLGQALTSGCIHVRNFWLPPKIFADEGEQNPLHFEYVSSYSCYSSTWLLLVLGSDATLLVNLQAAVIPYIKRYQSQHPEKYDVGLLMVTLHSIFTIMLPNTCASTFLQNFGFLSAH